ncbi:hypothetical protein [Actinorugispora endophytica]|uniref:Uncharacterized protein n=1 Tax=Actinorugispora endophytica TaxID=1605990 RepID=A0A4R6VDU6_9ACTN|nr:hypothetical protein [Actinorugispora endophytica]TDQ55187.1 hypothetical protein EV190_101512 [Actinorugispora endophytica]
MRFLYLLVSLLLAMATPVRRTGPAQPVLPAPRHAAPPRRQARPIPAPEARIPNYPAFAETAETHSPLWEITYEYGGRAPYTARHRANGTIVAAGDLATLDWALYAYVVPPTNPDIARARPPRGGRARAYAPAP